MGDPGAGDTGLAVMLEAGAAAAEEHGAAAPDPGAWCRLGGPGDTYFLAQVAAQSLSTLSLQASLYSTCSGRDTMTMCPAS